MQFAFPLYLAGLVLLGVPILLHFLKRRPATVMRYPSFFLLRELIRKQRRHTLLQYLVLLARCLALACLALAFAYPLFSQLPLRLDSATVILVDASFSMPDPAKRVEEVLAAIPEGNAMLAGRVTETTRWSGDFTRSKSELTAWIAGNRSSKCTSSFAAAIPAADSLLGRIQAKEKKIVVITDRQAVPWRSVRIEPPLRNATAFEVKFCADKPRRNLAIHSIQSDPPHPKAGEEVRLTATLRNYNPEAAEVRFDFFSEQEQLDSQRLTVPGRGDVRLELPLRLPEDGVPLAGRGVLTAADADNDITADDLFYFALNPRRPSKILLYGKSAPFLAEALDIHPGETSAEAENAELLLFDTLPRDRAKECIELARRQMGKGGLTAILWNGTAETQAFFEEFGFRIRRKSLPGIRKLETLQFDHRILRDYLSVNAGAWFDILFFEAPQLSVPPEAHVLATFTGDLPAIAELKYGAGRLFVFAASPDRRHTNWQTFGNFLPFWQELALYAKREESVPSALTAGNGLQRLPDGKLLALDVPGNYASGGRIYSINAPRRESETACLPESWDLAGIIDPAARERAAAAFRSEAETLKNAAAKNSLWRTLLLFALLFFLVETLLSNRVVRE